MAAFRRGLNKQAFERLTELAKSPDSWWRHLLQLWTPSGAAVGARPLRIAVRDGYLNFYLKGQSVSRVDFDAAGEPYAEVHVKYAFDNAAVPNEQSYAKLTCKNLVQSKLGLVTKYDGARTLRDWMAQAALWETPEKTAVERVIADNPTVIDLEMGLPAEGARKTSLRMDLVVLHGNERSARIVFWEAKRVSDSRVKSRSPQPEVMTQIAAYRDYLNNSANRENVITAYRRACETLVKLAEMAGNDCLKLLDRHVVKVAEAKCALEVDENPRLVIFGSGRELAAPSWATHQKKLERLGVSLKILRTDAYRLE